MFSLKSKIAVIGAGKVSYSLVKALLISGSNISSIVSLHLSSAKKLAEKFGIKNYSSDLSTLTSDIKIFFLCVPDNDILLVSRKLSKLNLDFNNSIFIHLSGAEDISVLKNLKKKGSLTASFHIMQSFPSKKVINLKGSFAAIETNSTKAKTFLFKLAKTIGLHPFKISSRNKIYYHIAGVYSSNFLVANQFYANELFTRIKSGVDSNKLFLPIVETTLRNIRENEVSNALSGPVERGDIKTVQKHLNALKNDKTLRSNYVSQSLTLLELLNKRDKRLSPSHRKLKNYLIKHS